MKFVVYLRLILSLLLIHAAPTRTLKRTKSLPISLKTMDLDSPGSEKVMSPERLAKGRKELSRLNTRLKQGFFRDSEMSPKIVTLSADKIKECDFCLVGFSAADEPSITRQGASYCRDCSQYLSSPVLRCQKEHSRKTKIAPVLFDVCGFCEENAQEWSITPCGHLLCQKCMGGWINTKGPASFPECPECQFDLTKSYDLSRLKRPY